MGRGEEKIELEDGMEAVDVLESCGYSVESAILRVNGDVALEDKEISKDDDLVVVPAISGG